MPSARMLLRRSRGAFPCLPVCGGRLQGSSVVVLRAQAASVLGLGRDLLRAFGVSGGLF